MTYASFDRYVKVATNAAQVGNGNLKANSGGSHIVRG